MRKKTMRLTALMLSVLVLLTVLPTGAIATEVLPTEGGGVTIADVAAGVASIYDLYGEEYVVDFLIQRPMSI